MEEILAGVQRKYENKVADLQTSVDKLLKVGFPTQPSLNRSSACTSKKTLCFLTSQACVEMLCSFKSSCHSNCHLPKIQSRKLVQFA